MAQDPYSVVKSIYVTEKSTVLQGLATAESNRSVAACKSPKAVFLVDPKANKNEIAKAVGTIYPGVKVVKVNTINRQGKRRRVRGRSGRTSALRKAIVTFEPGDTIEGLF